MIVASWVGEVTGLLVVGTLIVLEVRIAEIGKIYSDENIYKMYTRT